MCGGGMLLQAFARGKAGAAGWAAVRPLSGVLLQNVSAQAALLGKGFVAQLTLLRAATCTKKVDKKLGTFAILPCIISADTRVPGTF
jgi:hypothetical protein